MSTFGALAMPFQSDLLAASQASGIPLPLLAAQIMQESTFNPAAVSKTGAIGLGQVLPSTALDPGYGVTPIDPAKLTDPAENIRFTANYLAARGKAAGVEDWNDPAQAAKGLTAYNGGGDPKYAENVFRHVQPAGAVMQPLAGGSAPVATPQPAAAAPMGNGEQPQAPALRPFFKPQTVPVRPGVDMEGISPGARGIFEALSKANIPGLEVVSGYRDPERNARVGGAKGSQHVHGNALDINIEKLSEAQRQQVIDAAIAAGARGIGIYPGGRSLHFDVRETPTAWGANPSSPYSGVSDPNAYPSWARAGVAKLFGTELPAQVAAYAPTTGGPPRPSPFAPSQESSSTMATNPADLPAPGAVPAMAQPNPAASTFAIPGGTPKWGQADEEQLMLAMALLASAIPNGKPAPSIAEVSAPFMALRSKREDRAYQRSQDAQAQQNWQATHGLQVDTARRAQERLDREDQKPTFHSIKDPAGNTVMLQWTPKGGLQGFGGTPLPAWVTGSGAAPGAAETPASPATAPMLAPTMPEGVAGPAIPQELMPQIPVPPPFRIPKAPPGANTEVYARKMSELAAEHDSGEAPITKQIKQADGSEVTVQWDRTRRAFIPMVAPEGGNAVKAPPKLTEQQSKDLVFYNRGVQALKAFEDNSDAYASGMERLASTIPGGNYVVSEEFQKARQSGQNFLNTILRKDTGAAITKDEDTNYGGVFLPQPGDKPGTLVLKKEARRQAIEAVKMGLGPADTLAIGSSILSGPKTGDGTTGGTGGNEGAAAAPKLSQRDLQNVDLINRSRAAKGEPLKVLSPEHALTLKPGTRFEIPDGSGRIGVVPER